MVPDIKIKSVKINSKKSEFGKTFNTSRILTVENEVSAWAHNFQKIANISYDLLYDQKLLFGGCRARFSDLGTI